MLESNPDIYFKEFEDNGNDYESNGSEANYDYD